MELLQKIKKQYQQNLPFVAYRKPNNKKVFALLQQIDQLFFTKNYTESGFVFAPFNNTTPAILLPIKQSVFSSEEIAVKNEFVFKNTLKKNTLSKTDYTNLVTKAINAINNKQFKKVVLSRKETLQLKHFNLIETFKKLLQLYTNAFVYVWYHPKVGLWLGATPETLLKVNGTTFETMALAGTQTHLAQQPIVWRHKEIAEQQFVTDYVVSSLKKVQVKVTVSEVETIKAGNLLHLKTAISGTVAINKPLQVLIKALHPTPAVCGLPMQITQKFILENENYNRSFYTGFLGELNLVKNNTLLEKKTALYVNLRCMEVVQNNVFIYVGGGVTKDSNPQKEWEETVAKTTTIKKVLL